MSKTIQGIVTSSTCYYVPLNVPANIVINKKGHPIAIHRLDNGAGTHLFSKHDQQSTKFYSI